MEEIRGMITELGRDIKGDVTELRDLMKLEKNWGRDKRHKNGNKKK